MTKLPFEPQRVLNFISKLKVYLKSFIYIDHSLFHSFNPILLGMILMTFLYLRLCNNKSDVQGIEHFKSGEYNIALEQYNTYLLLHPHDLETLYNRGRCFEAIGQPGKAIEDYDEVLERDPGNYKALLSLSQIYYKEGKYELSINLCANAIMVNKDDYLAHYYKARAHHKNRDVTKALEEYNLTVDLNPDFGFAYFQRSSILISLGFMPFACYDLETAEILNVRGAREARLKYCLR